jgi:hypothetical protein
VTAFVKIVGYRPQAVQQAPVVKKFYFYAFTRFIEEPGKVNAVHYAGCEEHY